MVEKNVAYNRDSRSQEFADNDPLAQLAQLVAQEDRPPHVAPLAAQNAAPPATRREPEFNLEDELLREFAVYDAPRHEPIALDPANDVRAPVPVNEFMQRVESVFSRREPEVEPVAPQVPAGHEDYLVAEHAAPAPRSDLRDDFSDDPHSVAAVFDVNHRDQAPEPREPDYAAAPEAVVEAPVPAALSPEPRAYEQPVQMQQPVAAPQPATQYQPAPIQEPDWERMAETSGETAIDLASELEMSVADDAPSLQPTAPSLRKSSLDFSSLRLPLANFGTTRATPVAPKAQPQPAPAAIPAVEPRAPVADELTADVLAGQKMSAMDELIYDVARYEISNKSVDAAAPVARMEPVVTAAPILPAVEPVIKAQAVKPAPAPVRAEPVFETPVAAPKPVAPQPVVSAPAASAPVAASPVAPAPRVSAPVAPAPRAEAPAPVAASSAADDFDAFNDSDFELALEDIDFDIDLSEIANIEVAPAPVAQAAPAAQHATATKSAPVMQPKPAAAPIVAAAPVASRSQPQPIVEHARYEERRPAAQQPVAPVASLESLPFDPSQIGETEDAPETITELDVPELPVGVFEPKPVARRQEEDLDLDTELASLFASPASGGLDRHKNAAPRQAQPQPTQEEVDEFERALEQDFRRSMQEAAEGRLGSQTREDAAPEQQVRYAEDEREGGARRWFVPMAAAVGLLLVGGGTYALIGGGSSHMGSNGAPVIISADSEPTKVVPENPGGRVVPNQDKAVYDRVAGAAPSDPKQPSLISTNEEPVDVVQRTLIPEQLPMEDEADQMQDGTSTPVGETEDPRLLSRGENTQTADHNGQSGVNVSPRKVRTMIVKPDGTLVAQEVPAPAAETPQQDKVEELAAPATTEKAPSVLATSRVPVTPEQPAQAAQTSARPAPAAAQPAQTQTAAPLPAARPSSQPANVVATVTNQGNVRPAAPAQPAQQTASAAPAAATSTPSSGGYYIQIASLPSQAEAQKSYQNMSAKFGSVIGGRGVDIKAAEIAGKGTFYRVRIPAGDKNEAAALCERFRSAGGSCLVAR
ncbi:SPOR domain-containing protein [Rhizobium rhizogenes]|uniref:SPOR domain-containing protein n=1 Tax=Rhizobium rhizogenes TaxID=359 RepID=A0AA92C4Q1_RHIRH|nr:SPOR domain-containing protein [Rhizobium rhizogenes]PVE55407.1 SPOR domain-containing protein [Rhizobium rhizogenes]PVE65671.1 SPOR domain-containing protein [Agrobacterium tumefaciens]PVE75735.1 SPOR domain-containing protein [Sphingomonas sp. TPD3009]